MRFKRRYLTLSLLLISACAQADEQFGTLQEEVIAPGNRTLIHATGFHEAALWSGKSNTEGWTNAVVSVVRAHMSEFDRARDVEEFCPGYRQASQAQKETCWVRLVSAVSKYESGFNPRDTFREVTGQMSIGLLSLSPGECAEARSSAALKQPIPNLTCGTRMMADLIARDGSIESPAPSRGAATYWSVLRRSRSKRHRGTGHKNQIMSSTREYRAYQPN
jgi:hypothetical protein